MRFYYATSWGSAQCILEHGFRGWEHLGAAGHGLYLASTPAIAKQRRPRGCTPDTVLEVQIHSSSAAEPCAQQGGADFILRNSNFVLQATVYEEPAGGAATFFVSPTLHYHPLRYAVVGRFTRRCDVCREQIKRKVFGCIQCNFDVCTTCFAERDGADNTMIPVTDDSVICNRHEHPLQYSVLQYDVSERLSRCDVCDRDVSPMRQGNGNSVSVGDTEAYRCLQCDFALCLRCYADTESRAPAGAPDNSASTRGNNLSGDVSGAAGAPDSTPSTRGNNAGGDVTGAAGAPDSSATTRGNNATHSGDAAAAGAASGGRGRRSSSDSHHHSTESQCIVCFDAENTHVFVPCGHQSVCKTCGDLIMEDSKTCPVCRQPAQVLIQVFKS
jgi:hypothetical protein